MAQIKVRGAQLNIQDVASEIAADSTAIGSIATGITSDPGSKATLDGDYLRLDGTNQVTADLDLGSFNLLTTGLVDGRNVSVDGANLDAHRADVSIHFTEASINHSNIIGIGTYTHADIDNHINDLSIHRTINDAGSGGTDLWSASKIILELATKSDVGHTHAFNDLSDVIVGTATSNQGIIFNGTDWTNADIILNASNVGLGGISVFSAKNADILEFNGIAAGTGGEIVVSLDSVNNNVVIDADPTVIASGHNIGDIADVTLTSPSVDDYLRFNGTDWANASFTTSVQTSLGTLVLSDIGDVANVAPNTNEVLMWDGTAWTPTVLPSGVTEFINLTDTPVTYATNARQFVVVNVAEDGLEFLPATLNDLFDVNTSIGSPGIPDTDQVLGFNGTEWVPQTGSTRTYYKAVKSSAGTLSVGTPVYIVGHNGTYITVEQADASNTTTMPAVGIVATPITDTTEGEVVVSGVVSGFDTSAWSVGAEIYVSAGGGLATPPPTGESNLIQKVAEVLVQDATNGQIHVVGAGRTNATPNLNSGNFWIGDATNIAVSANFATSVTAELNVNSIDELSDVDTTTTTPVVDDALIFDGTNWVPAAIVNSFNGRTGTVLPTSGDYTAADITNVPFGNIAATDVQSAINELDTEKADVNHTHLLNDLVDVVLAGGSPPNPVTYGDVLWFDGTNWINSPDSKYATSVHTHLVADITDFSAGVTAELNLNSINELSDVDTTTSVPVTNDALVFDGTNWVPAAIVNSFNGRTGAVLPLAGDYTAADIDFIPTGSPGISAANVQQAIEEVYNEKADVLHTHLVADITDFSAGVTAELNANSIDALSDVDTTTSVPVTNDALVFDGTNWVPSAIVNSFNGRTGAVSPASGDYTAADITNTPAGNIAATDVQSAINELDTEKAPLASPAFTGVVGLPIYTKATLPTVVEGALIYVSDAVTVPGSPAPVGVMCFGRAGSPAAWIDVLTGLPVA